MKIEVIAIGSEILSGKTVNTNATYISKKLKKSGYQTFFHLVISDHKQDIENNLKTSIQRSDLVIVTGGLGPTIDDNTKDIVCSMLEFDLEYNKEIAEDIKKRFGSISSLKNQATLPKNALILKNEIGTAAGFILQESDATIIFLPGVPEEMKQMFDCQAIGFIEKHFPLKEKIYEEIINICLLEEVKVNQVLKKIKTDGIELGIYPNHGVIHVSLTAKAQNQRAADEKFNPIKQRVISEFSEYIFEAENGLIEEAVHNMLIDKNKKLAFAESCTGGQLAARITSLAGSSKYFLGSFVTYSNDLKNNILKVKEKTLKETGAVSIETVKEMVKSIFSLTDADYAVAVSGIAGPKGGSREKPVGTVCVAIAERNEEIDSGIFHFKGNRDLIVKSSINHILGILFRKIAHNKMQFTNDL